MSKKKLDGTTTVLVTGSNGFIGSHLCSRLIGRLGCKVVGIDSVAPKNIVDEDGRYVNSSNSIYSVYDRDLFSFKQVDISNSNDVDEVYMNNSIDFVFHLAALANPRTCKANFDLAFKVNVLGTKNIIEKSRKDSRIIFMSSAAVYGNPLRLPIPEDHLTNGSDPYALTKVIGENLCRCFLVNYERDICIGRNFNTFGEGQIADYIIPTLIKQAVNERRIELWNFAPVRDFLHIDDALNAITVIAESGKSGEKYNIGSGKGTRIGELASIVRNIVDKKMPFVDLQKQVTGSSQLVADISKLKKLGWVGPTIELDVGLRRTIDWFKYYAPVTKCI